MKVLRKQTRAFSPVCAFAFANVRLLFQPTPCLNAPPALRRAADRCRHGASIVGLVAASKVVDHLPLPARAFFFFPAGNP